MAHRVISFLIVAGVAELKEFTTLEGEASASNRKSKLIFFYEWDIKIKWTGTTAIVI